MKHTIAIWGTALLLFIFHWPTGLICIPTAIYLTVKKRERNAEEKQQEIEEKEIEMIRKSNEILLHLIQDQNRSEDR